MGIRRAPRRTAPIRRACECRDCMQRKPVPTLGLTSKAEILAGIVVRGER